MEVFSLDSSFVHVIRQRSGTSIRPSENVIKVDNNGLKGESNKPTFLATKSSLDFSQSESKSSEMFDEKNSTGESVGSTSSSTGMSTTSHSVFSSSSISPMDKKSNESDEDQEMESSVGIDDDFKESEGEEEDNGAVEFSSSATGLVPHSDMELKDEFAEIKRNLKVVANEKHELFVSSIPKSSSDRIRKAFDNIKRLIMPNSKIKDAIKFLLDKSYSYRLKRLKNIVVILAGSRKAKSFFNNNNSRDFNMLTTEDKIFIAKIYKVIFSGIIDHQISKSKKDYGKTYTDVALGLITPIIELQEEMPANLKSRLEEAVYEKELVGKKLPKVGNRARIPYGKIKDSLESNLSLNISKSAFELCWPFKSSTDSKKRVATKCRDIVTFISDQLPQEIKLVLGNTYFVLSKEDSCTHIFMSQDNLRKAKGRILLSHASTNEIWKEPTIEDGDRNFLKEIYQQLLATALDIFSSSNNEKEFINALVEGFTTSIYAKMPEGFGERLAKALGKPLPRAEEKASVVSAEEKAKPAPRTEVQPIKKKRHPKKVSECAKQIEEATGFAPDMDDLEQAMQPHKSSSDLEAPSRPWKRFKKKNMTRSQIESDEDSVLDLTSSSSVLSSSSTLPKSKPEDVKSESSNPHGFFNSNKRKRDDRGMPSSTSSAYPSSASISTSSSLPASSSASMSTSSSLSSSDGLQMPAQENNKPAHRRIPKKSNEQLIKEGLLTQAQLAKKRGYFAKPVSVAQQAVSSAPKSNPIPKPK